MQSNFDPPSLIITSGDNQYWLGAYICGAASAAASAAVGAAAAAAAAERPTKRKMSAFFLLAPPLSSRAQESTAARRLLLPTRRTAFRGAIRRSKDAKGIGTKRTRFKLGKKRGGGEG